MLTLPRREWGPRAHAKGRVKLEGNGTERDLVSIHSTGGTLLDARYLMLAVKV